MTNADVELQKMREALGQRVLVSVYDGQPRMTCVRAFTPSGQYVWLGSMQSGDENVGWQHVARVKLLEVLGPGTELLDELETKLKPVTTSPLITASATT